MKALFSQAGTKALAKWAQPGTLWAFDFDGTLAAITADPDRARMSTSVASSLRRLSKEVFVAVISGRELANLKARMKGLHIALIGNHGIQGNGVSKKSLRRFRSQRAEWRRQFEQLLQQQPAYSKMFEVEDKVYSLSIHFRKAKNRSRARLLLESWASHLKPTPRIVGGKCVVNLIPLGTPHKGDALEHLLKRMKARRALFVGDDDTDEDVFSLKNKRFLTVRIGRRKNSSAHFYIRNQRDIGRLLQRLLKVVTAERRQ